MSDEDIIQQVSDRMHGTPEVDWEILNDIRKTALVELQGILPRIDILTRYIVQVMLGWDHPWTIEPKTRLDQVANKVILVELTCCILSNDSDATTNQLKSAYDELAFFRAKIKTGLV